MEQQELIIKSKYSRALKGDERFRVFSVRLRLEVFDQIESIIAQTGHSRNELVTILIDYALNHYGGIEDE